MHATTHSQLAEARIAVRNMQDEHDRVKAEAEQRAIIAAGGAKNLGANAEDRARALTLALEADTAYVQARTTLRERQAGVDRLQAQLDDAIDARRTADRESRDRLSNALEQLGVRSDEEADAVTVLATPTHRAA